MARAATLKKRIELDNPRAAVDGDGLLGQRLRLRRQELGLSQMDLAAGLGLTFQQVQKYEKGTNRIAASRLKQIADILKVPVSFFYAEQNSGAEVESLLNLDGKFSLRLLRAYSKIGDQVVAHSLVAMLEAMTRDL